MCTAWAGYVAVRAVRQIVVVLVFFSIRMDAMRLCTRVGLAMAPSALCVVQRSAGKLLSCPFGRLHGLGWLCRRLRCAPNRCRSGFFPHGCYEAVCTGGAGYGAVRAMRSAAFSGQIVVVHVFSALDVMGPCARLGLAMSPSALCAMQC